MPALPQHQLLSGSSTSLRFGIVRRSWRGSLRDGRAAQNFSEQLVNHGPLLGEDAAGDTLAARGKETNDDPIPADAQPNVASQIGFELLEITLLLFQPVQRLAEALSWFRRERANEVRYLRVEFDANPPHQGLTVEGTCPCRFGPDGWPSSLLGWP